MTDTELRIRVAVLERDLGNVYLLAKKPRYAMTTAEVKHLLRFCEEAGFTSSPLRAEVPGPSVLDGDILHASLAKEEERVQAQFAPRPVCRCGVPANVGIAHSAQGCYSMPLSMRPSAPRPEGEGCGEECVGEVHVDENGEAAALGITLQDWRLGRRG